MFNGEDASVLIKKDKAKKKVTWIDNKDDGKIEKEVLTVLPAASTSKASLNKEMNQLIKAGYTPNEAASHVGKPYTIGKAELFKEPSFYDSQEKIKEQKEARDKNRNGFFSMEKIGLGVVVLGVAISVGMALTKGK